MKHRSICLSLQDRVSRMLLTREVSGGEACSTPLCGGSHVSITGWTVFGDEARRVQVVTDFFDELKSRSQGYASMEYHVTGYRQNHLVRLDIRINNEPAEPLATIVHRDSAYRVGRALTKRLRELIPRQQFRIPIQAAIGSKVIAAESLSGVPDPDAVNPPPLRTSPRMCPEPGPCPDLSRPIPLLAANAYGCVGLLAALSAASFLGCRLSRSCSICSAAKGCAGKVLWRRRLPEEKAAQEAGQGQEAHEGGYSMKVCSFTIVGVGASFARMLTLRDRHGLDLEQACQMKGADYLLAEHALRALGYPRFCCAGNGQCGRSPGGLHGSAVHGPLRGVNSNSAVGGGGGGGGGGPLDMQRPVQADYRA